MKPVAPDICQNREVFIWTLTNYSNQCVLWHCFIDSLIQLVVVNKQLLTIINFVLPNVASNSLRICSGAAFRMRSIQSLAVPVSDWSNIVCFLFCDKSRSSSIRWAAQRQCLWSASPGPGLELPEKFLIFRGVASSSTWGLGWPWLWLLYIGENNVDLGSSNLGLSNSMSVWTELPTVMGLVSISCLALTWLWVPARESSVFLQSSTPIVPSFSNRASISSSVGADLSGGSPIPEAMVARKKQNWPQRNCPYTMWT